MKLEDIKSDEDILNYIEGCFNDFEAGVSTKAESMNLVLDLLLHCVNAKIKKP